MFNATRTTFTPNSVSRTKFFSLFKLTRVETSSKQTRKPRIWRQKYRRLSFLCNAHALSTNPLRCPDTNRIRVDGRIRFVYATCGRRYFCIRMTKFADTKISGYLQHSFAKFVSCHNCKLTAAVLFTILCL